MRGLGAGHPLPDDAGLERRARASTSPSGTYRASTAAPLDIRVASERLAHLRKRLRFAQSHGEPADILILAEAVMAAWAVLAYLRGY